MVFLHEKAYINGEWIAKQQTFAVENPFNKLEIAQVADCGIEDVKKAIDAAHDALKVWSSYTAAKRSKILRAWYDLQMKYAKDLAILLTSEQGKPITEALGEINYGASFVEWFAEEAKRIYGDVIPGHANDKRITVIKQPIGVVGAITPWNFPHAMITRKVAPALAAGCTVVIKPADLTPLSALALAELAEKAGFPPGVLNVVTCKDPEAIGKELTTNPKVKKISFTGSTQVGKLLLEQSASTVKKVSLELGGNAPFIVFADADIDEAVEGCIASKFRNGGQTCVCTNRIFVAEAVKDEFIEKLSVQMKKLKIGNGLDQGTDIGPMINAAAISKNQGLLRDAQAKGATVKFGGNTLESRFFEPTLLCDLTTEMDIFSTEIFGPIAAVYTFNTEEEVIDMANDTPFGLAAYFYGRDYALIWRVAEALDYGMVGINTGMISTAVAPFGGVKESGFGREGSKYGIDDFVKIKYMCWGGVV